MLFLRRHEIRLTLHRHGHANVAPAGEERLGLDGIEPVHRPKHQTRDTWSRVFSCSADVKQEVSHGHANATPGFNPSPPRLCRGNPSTRRRAPLGRQ